MMSTEPALDKIKRFDEARYLTAQGGDEARIQAQGRVDRPGSSRIEIIFSNAEGEFPQPPVENS